MRSGWRGRLKEWWCDKFGHRCWPDPWEQTVVCRRCNVLLAGSLTYPYLPNEPEGQRRLAARQRRGAPDAVMTDEEAGRLADLVNKSARARRGQSKDHFR